MSSDFYDSRPGYRISTADWVVDSVVRPTQLTSPQNMLDELNRRLIDMENKLSAYASKVQTVEASNAALTEMVEYLKAVANGEI